VGVSTLEPLAQKSGGCLILYANRGGEGESWAESCTLPGDVFRQCAAPRAGHCSLRLRTSHEFSVANAYGNLSEDRTFPGLYHMGGCDPLTTVAFDFEYSGPSGFAETEVLPTVQLAFSYTTVSSAPEETEPREDYDEDDGDVSGSDARGNGSDRPHLGGISQWDEGESEGESLGSEEAVTDQVTAQGHLVRTGARMTRRLRERSGLRVVRRILVVTQRFHVAQTPRVLFESASAPVVLSLLIHKLFEAVGQEGWAESRMLAQDWLVRLLVCYARCYPNAQTRSGRGLAPDPKNLSCSLRPLVRLLFALVTGPLLSSGTPLCAHPYTVDERAAVKFLYATLPPRAIEVAVYPALLCYSAENGDVSQLDLRLSYKSVEKARGDIFLLDSYTSLVLYKRAPAPPPKAPPILYRLDSAPSPPPSPPKPSPPSSPQQQQQQQPQPQQQPQQPQQPQQQQPGMGGMWQQQPPQSPQPASGTSVTAAPVLKGTPLRPSTMAAVVTPAAVTSRMAPTSIPPPPIQTGNSGSGIGWGGLGGGGLDGLPPATPSPRADALSPVVLSPRTGGQWPPTLRSGVRLEVERRKADRLITPKETVCFGEDPLAIANFFSALIEEPLPTSLRADGRWSGVGVGVGVGEEVNSTTYGYEQFVEFVLGEVEKELARDGAR